MISAAEIAAQIAALDERADLLTKDLDSLSLAALDGDAGAGGEISRLLAETARLTAERPILVRACAMAKDREVQKAHEANEAGRAEALGQAWQEASKLVALAGEVDEIFSRLPSLIDGLAASERAIHQHLNKAGTTPSGALDESKEGATMPIQCPCCSQELSRPTLDAVVVGLNLTPLQERILRAVWAGKGRPVMPVRIFDYMYEDDPNGGPSEALAYRSFKVALCRLRQRIEGTGVSILSHGYGAGYRLKFDEVEETQAA